MFYTESKDKSACCGCTACVQKCPTGALEMSGGYPVKDTAKCVSCNSCERVCPVINSPERREGHEAYMLEALDERLLDQSSSGGAFSAVAQSFCTGDFSVYGVKWGKNFDAVYDRANALDDIAKFRKSKYVDSIVGNVYINAKKDLDSGKKVLFSGTPCRIAGLNKFLGREYDKLLTVDVVCHGVPVDGLFPAYLDCRRNSFGSEIYEVGFRYKTKASDGTMNSRNIMLMTDSGKKVLASWNDFFLRGYHNRLFYRDSCYSCPFARRERVSDITIGDFWGVETLFPGKDVHRGVSLVLANTSKGTDVISHIEGCALEDVNYDAAVSLNKQLNEPSRPNPQRSKFFELLPEIGFDKAVDICLPKPSLIKRCIGKAKRVIGLR